MATIKYKKNGEWVKISNVKIMEADKEFTGHYDSAGLKAIGWTDEEIAYYQKNGVQWDESEDDIFKLDSNEIAGTLSTKARFLPKSSTATTFSGYYNLLAIPQVNTGSRFTMKQAFYNCYSLTTIPELKITKSSSYEGMFQNCYSLSKVPLLTFSTASNFKSMFQSCRSLKTIPLMDFSRAKDISYLFQECSSLKTIPKLDFTNATNLQHTFYECKSLTELPELNLPNATDIGSICYNCSSLRRAKLKNTSTCTNFSYAFYGCGSLFDIGNIDTSSAVNVGSMFYNCYSLTSVPLLDLSNCTNLTYLFYGCNGLENLEGFKDLGKAYLTTVESNYTNYSLNLNSSTKLTEQSMINVLNNLYDIASMGVPTQTVMFGSTNLAKLTSAEGQTALANARTKGWTIS